jgi:hypothetical protein
VLFNTPLLGLLLRTNWLRLTLLLRVLTLFSLRRTP